MVFSGRFNHYCVGIFIILLRNKLPRIYFKILNTNKIVWDIGFYINILYFRKHITWGVTNDFTRGIL